MDSYHKSDLSIVFTYSPAAWFWAVIDDEQESLEFGQSADYESACRIALAAFDRLTSPQRKDQ